MHSLMAAVMDADKIIGAAAAAAVLLMWLHGSNEGKLNTYAPN